MYLTTATAVGLTAVAVIILCNYTNRTVPSVFKLKINAEIFGSSKIIA